ncbi:MAG: hypothetical protein KBE90_02945 [Ottowia sp.]|nr:hypothetical protein [Ottowia sp.]MBP9522413.1 hypothetical protein [Ottowia sp.]
MASHRGAGGWWRGGVVSTITFKESHRMTGSALLNKPARSARRRALSSLAAAAMLLSRRWIEVRARGLRVIFGLEIGPGAC